jgi:hypothetical protein
MTVVPALMSASIEALVNVSESLQYKGLGNTYTASHLFAENSR